MNRRYFVTGGAGFIGSNLVNHLLTTSDCEVTVYDSFLTGNRHHFGERINDSRLAIVEADFQDEDQLTSAMLRHDMVYHFAANSDIASAQSNPSIDFNNGTVLTHKVLEAMRKTGVKRIAFTSGSGVYGEVDPVPVPENCGHMVPISTYGASKLASECLISAYSFMFEITSTVFRFANVVGPLQTHGVAFDFIRRLAKDGTQLMILGDGTQSKPYIHIEDVISAFKLLEEQQQDGFGVYNVGTQDHLTVREIADIVCHRMGLQDVKYNFTGGSRGWKADVPVYRLDTSKIRKTGWQSHRNSRQAVEASVDAMLGELGREGAHG